MTRNPVGDNEAFSAVYWSAKVNAHTFEFVHDGIVPSKGTGSFDVDTTSGNVQVGSTRAAVTAQTTTLAAADPDPRVDLVVCDNTGTVSAVTGTAAADPVAPDIPSGQVLIAAVFVPGGATSITASDIFDYRILGQFENYPVTAADIATGAVGTAELADDAVTDTKIVNGGEVPNLDEITFAEGTVSVASGAFTTIYNPASTFDLVGGHFTFDDGNNIGGLRYTDATGGTTTFDLTGTSVNWVDNPDRQASMIPAGNLDQIEVFNNGGTRSCVFELLAAF